MVQRIRYSCQILIKLYFPDIISKTPFKYKISWKSVHLELHCSTWTGVQTRPKLMGAFRNFAKATINSCPSMQLNHYSWSLRPTI